MNYKNLRVALGIALSVAVISAGAQKKYTEGVLTYNTSIRGQLIEMKEYFTPDSNAVTYTIGSATIKILSDANQKSFAILVDVPQASIKKAAVMTPDEIEQAKNGLPGFTFAPGSETRLISGFNCTKVIATNTKDHQTYEIWVTRDIVVPSSAIPAYYREIGGFPVQYSVFQNGKSSDVTVSGVTGQKAPPGTFGIAPDFDKITMNDLKAMTGEN
ncbi:MAG TPA: hypothetical protein VFV08_15065 [Puia sp.]|nr:hypothetical protein [Puia sp.]